MKHEIRTVDTERGTYGVTAETYVASPLAQWRRDLKRRLNEARSNDFKICGVCGVRIERVLMEISAQSDAQWGKRKYCSPVCCRVGYGRMQKEKWQDPEYRAAQLLLQETVHKRVFPKKGVGRPSNRGSNNVAWRGESASYGVKHSWIRKIKGIPVQCSVCMATGVKIEWSNVDHRYRRIVDDYSAMCCKCHSEYHKKHGLRTHSPSGEGRRYAQRNSQG